MGAPDYTVLGDSVNLAARLVAPPGPADTLMSEGVQRALADAVMREALGEMQRQGLRRAGAYLATDRPLGRARGGKRSPFVGRKAELEQFKGIARACVGGAAGHVVYVRGEAGIGKTRLVEEMRRLAEARASRRIAACVLDFGVGKGQDPMRALLFSLLGLAPQRRDAASAREEVERCVAARLWRPNS